MNDPIVQKVAGFIEETLIEGGLVAPKTLRVGACAAVIKNSWARTEFAKDLHPRILSHTKALADLVGPRVFNELMSVDQGGAHLSH